MMKLREAVMELARSEWGKPLSVSQVNRIERCLLRAFPVVRTPTHPTYSLMILKALEALGPSTEDSVAEYIKATFEDLPWANRSYTRYHLNQLREKGSITFSVDKRYVILGFTPETHSSNPNRLNPDGQSESDHAGYREGLSHMICIEDNVKENIKVTGKRNLKRSRCTVVFDDEDDEPEEVGITGDERRCATSECEIQVGVEKDRELRYLKNGVSHKEDNVEDHFIRRSEEGALAEHQTDVLIKDLIVAKGAHGVLDKRMFVPKQEMIKPIEEQLVVTECQNETRIDMTNFGSDTSSDPKLLPGSGKMKSPSGKKKKEAVEHDKGTDIICGLPTQSQMPDKQRRKGRTKQARLEHKQQVMKLPQPDFLPSSDLSEANEQQHEYEQDRSPELNMPLIFFKESSMSNREKARAVDFEKSKWPIGVQSFVKASFFHPCKVHSFCGGPPSRSRCCWFCLRCMNEAFCSLCLENHCLHPTIKVKLSVYEESLDVKDAKEVHLDISGIETHTLSGYTSVSLRRKLKSRSRKGVDTKPCRGCERRVHSAFEFCSLRCKNQIMVGTSGLSRNI